jgi:hypothetical protein
MWRNSKRLLASLWTMLLSRKLSTTSRRRKRRRQKPGKFPIGTRRLRRVLEI